MDNTVRCREDLYSEIWKHTDVRAYIWIYCLHCTETRTNMYNISVV